MDDLRDGCDAMQADMAAHQERFGGNVTAAANQSLAAQAFEQIEREIADAKPASVSPVAFQAPVERKTERREVDGKKYLMSTSPGDDIIMRKASPAEQWFLDHALPRVELLLSKPETGPLGQPSWMQRTLAVLEIASRVASHRAGGRPDLAAMADKQYMFELVELLEASNQTFGDWKKDAPKKLVVSG